jgi:hypothetical protein
MNPHAQALGKLGGLKKSERKTLSNQKNSELARVKRWENHPKKEKTPPDQLTTDIPPADITPQ